MSAVQVAFRGMCVYNNGDNRNISGGSVYNGNNGNNVHSSNCGVIFSGGVSGTYGNNWYECSNTYGVTTLIPSGPHTTYGVVLVVS